MLTMLMLYYPWQNRWPKTEYFYWPIHFDNSKSYILYSIPHSSCPQLMNSGEALIHVSTWFISCLH